MSIEFGPAAAGQRSAVARVRGAGAGSISGAISVAAHGWASGGMPPSGTTLVLLAAACAVVGALVAGLAPLRETSVGLIAVLIAGQLLGHLTMGWSSGQMHHGDAQLGPGMLTAHLVAAMLAAVVIRGAEAAYRIGCAVLSRVLPMRYHPPAIAGPVPPFLTHRDRVVLRIFAAESLRTRGPPLAIRL
ncbi:hypothetical protein OG874_26540 [Nocardia sp. NBC_00565]|uniref:hypothetical protein n=1 Tax=Nocardia sp. NBC_00565 TaxID=2975993 RepID=UPI002E81B15C|nr:hypothetical protein [Nocardia sp. NBC_00565]WUC00439.1 hypothetical protein OG874_26540 [Nocardia sp. NBC_00565]